MRRLAVVLVIPLALGACAGSETTQAESAAGTVDTLIKACAAGRPHVALEVLTDPAKDALVKANTVTRGCLELLGLRFEGVAPRLVPDELRVTRVVSVDANDLGATANLSTPGGEHARVELEKSRGVWSVTHAAAPTGS
jgi:hypothetical protein